MLKTISPFARFAWAAAFTIAGAFPALAGIPSVTVTAPAGPTNSATLAFTVVFSEAVNGFNTPATDLVIGGTAGGTLVGAIVPNSATNYTVNITGMAAPVGTVTLEIPAGAASSQATADPNTISNTGSVIWDGVPPAVTINQAVAQTDPSNSATIVFTAVFSEAVSNFVNADVTVGGTAGATTAAVSTSDNITWTIDVTGMTMSGTVTASIAAGVAQDAAGNTNAASTSTDNTVTYDNVPPSVTINQAVAQPDPSNSTTIVFTAVFSEAVTGFTNSDVSLSGTALPTTAAVSTSDNITWTINVTGMSMDGTVIATIPAAGAQDAAGNNNGASTSTDNTVTIDITPPSVTIDQAVAQPDPTPVSPVLFTAVFSESVTGFTNGDVSLSGTAGATTANVSTADNITWTISVSGMTSGGTVIASIGAGVAQDALGNNNLASSSTDNTVNFQFVPSIGSPTVASIAESSATLGGTISSNGGSAITERGTVWKTTPGVTISDNKLAEGGTSTGTFSHSRTSLPSGVQIYFRAYATNSVGTALTAELSFYTFSAVPAANPASVVATAVSTTQINLTFSAASTITNAAGYLILRRVGADPSTSEVQDGLAPGSLPLVNSVVVANITSLAQTAYSDMGLTQSTDYHYAVVPYNWDGANAATYNYRSGGGFATDNDDTFSANSDIILNGGTTTNIAYKDFQTASGLTAGNSEQLAQLQIRDGGASSDSDNKTTTLTSLTISVTNWANIRTIALFDGGTNASEVSVTGPTVTFTPVSLSANDNNTNDIQIRATFNAIVTDNQFIGITVTAATAASTGSIFAAADAGGATTGGATNKINVVAVAMAFTGNPAPTQINTNFSITVNAIDNLNNIDLDRTSQVTLSKSGGNPSGVLTATPQALNPNLVAGTFTWTSLRINLSGTYTLTAAVSGLVSANGSVTIQSNGVNITPGSVPLSPMCYSGAFQTLSTITISESDPADFAVGSGQIFSLVLPAGFIFNTALNPSPTLTGTELTTPVAATYVGNNIVRVGYTVTGGTNLNTIQISGLQVKYTGNTPTSGNILRYGGTAVQAGNGDADGKNHGTLTAAPSATVVTFTVQELPGDPVQDPNETRFSINTNAVKLIGSPSGGVFTGNGVIFTGGQYTFNPSSVGVGNSYVVTYTYNEPGGQQCQVVTTKTFEVYASVIGNLGLKYCTNDAPSTGLNVPQGQIDALFGPGYSFHDFVYYLPGFGYTPITPTNTTFDPASSNYTSTTSIYGGVYVYYRVHNNLTPASPIYAQYQFVTMSVAPNVSFTLPKTSFCEDEAPVVLTGTPTNSTNTTNDFFAASGGQGGAISFSGVNPVTWFFSPSAVAGVPPSQTFDITYTYKDPYTLCTNTSAPIAITVHPRPGIVPGSDITSGIARNTCVNGASVTFTTAPSASTTYNWYTLSDLSDAPQTGPTFTPSIPTQFDVSTPGTTNFYVTRTINGCESSQAPLTLNAVVDQPAIANAGSDFTVCAGNEVVFSSFSIPPSISGSASSATWSVVGTSPGQFVDGSNNPTTTFGVATKYIPSAGNIASGSVRLVLTTNDPAGPCTAVSDDVTITINPSVVVNAGFDAVVCAGDAVVLNGNITGGTTSGTWTRNGQGGFGSGNTPTITDPLTFYNPSNTELTSGASITFTLTSDDPDGGGPCPAIADDVIITINQRAYVNAGPDQILCDGVTIQLAGFVPANSSASSFTWSGGLGGFSPDANTGNAVYTPDPTEIGSQVEFTLTSNDPDGTGPTGPCPAEADQVRITINAIPAAPLANPPNPYCVGDAIQNLTAVGTNLRWYDNPSLGAGNLRGVGASFATGETSNTEKTVDYFVTQTINSCESPSTTSTIVVNPLPVVNFSGVNFCLGDYMTFTDASTVNNGTIAKWSWAFGDGFNLPLDAGPIPAGTHGGETTGDFNNPSHRFSAVGQYNVIIRVESDKGCQQQGNQQFNVGDVPVANFSIQDICDQDLTQLTYTGTLPASPGQINSWAWNFDDPASGANNTASGPNPSHTFSGVGQYSVSLSVTTALGCQDMTTKTAVILPYIKSFPYRESFETANHGWASAGLNTNGFNSWNLTSPAGSVINAAADGSNAWITRDNTLGTYQNNERSVLFSPCFDMTQLQRPVLSLQYWNNTDLRNDGAYIEYSTNNGLTWSVLGGLNQGLDWYNQGAVLGLSQQNNVGQTVAQIGWTGNTNGWTTGKLNLDSRNNDTKLRLRIVFGSNPDNPAALDGFALDDFVIETRNRIILGENFTNSLALGAAANRQAFVDFPNTSSSEIVKLTYHVGIPEADDINKQNPADPNARAAFYGLTNSNISIPRVYLDGQSNPNGDGSNPTTANWAGSRYDSRTLVTSPLNIAISTVPGDANMFAVSATLTATSPITSGRPAIFFVVIEKSVGSESFVVRKMIPSAAGMQLQLPIALNDQVTITPDPWEVKNINSINELAVLVFVQDLDTREVLQAAYLPAPSNLPTVVTGDEAFLIDNLQAFPVPADKDLTINLPMAVLKETPILLIDQVGKVVESTLIGAGETSKTIAVENLAEGIYILSVQVGKDQLARKKVLITHSR